MALQSECLAAKLEDAASTKRQARVVVPPPGAVAARKGKKCVAAKNPSVLHGQREPGDPMRAQRGKAGPGHVRNHPCRSLKPRRD